MRKLSEDQYGADWSAIKYIFKKVLERFGTYLPGITV